MCVCVLVIDPLYQRIFFVLNYPYSEYIVYMGKLLRLHNYRWVFVFVDIGIKNAFMDAT